MLSACNVLNFRCCFILLVVFCLSVSRSAADDKKLIKSMERLLEEMRNDEVKLKSKAFRKIQKKQKDARNDIMDLMFDGDGDERFTNSRGSDLGHLRSREKRLRRWVSQTRLLRVKAHTRPADEENVHEQFKYRVHYAFEKESLIKGRVLFLPRSKVRLTYQYKGKKETKFLSWEDHGDHITIDTKSKLGHVFISGRPNSDKGVIIIRWGGELKHRLTDGVAQ